MDTVQKTWQHLNFFEHECHLHARVPRIKRDDGKARFIPTPWQGKVSGFTLLFEALSSQLCKAMCVHNVSDLKGVSYHKIWRVYVGYLYSLQTHFSDTKLGQEHASLFVYTLLAIIVPFTSSMSSNLWRGLGVLFGIDIKKKRFYTFMASSALPWESLWRSTWGLIDCT